MAGYSGTPLVKKLGFKNGHRACIINEPAGFRDILEDLPESVSIDTKFTGRFDVIVLFAKNASELEAKFPKAVAGMKPDGMLWVAWPKKSSGVKTDLVEGAVRQTGLSAGVVDIKVCAIDDTWSGLKFMVRLKDRPK